MWTLVRRARQRNPSAGEGWICMRPEEAKKGEWRHGGLEGLKMPSHGLVYPKVAGLGHAWVGQILLNCDVFKR